MPQPPRDRARRERGSEGRGRGKGKGKGKGMGNVSPGGEKRPVIGHRRASWPSLSYLRSGQHWVEPTVKQAVFVYRFPRVLWRRASDQTIYKETHVFPSCVTDTWLRKYWLVVFILKIIMYSTSRV